MISPRTDVPPNDHLSADRLAALADGAEPADDEACHLLACPVCAAAVSGEPFPSPLDDLPLLRAAPPAFDLVDGERRLLEAATRRETFLSPSRVAFSGGLLLVAAAALLFVAVRQQAPADATIRAASHATIEASPGSEVSPVARGGDEIVGLVGEAAFAVRPIPPGERFRVRVGADEVEVRGTRFVVQTEGPRLARVTVSEGVVDVRPVCCSPVTLRAGESWSAPPPSMAEPAPGPSSAPSATPSAAPPPSAATTSNDAPSGAELLAQGTAAYDAGRYAAAAVLLSRAVATEPQASWARDTTTLAGAARVLSTPAANVPALAVSVASFDTASTRARQRGDAKLAAAAALGAARHLSGKAAESRFCALKTDGALSEAQRKEAEGRCRR